MGFKVDKTHLLNTWTRFSENCLQSAPTYADKRMYVLHVV